MSEPIYMVGQISVKDIPVYLERYAAPVAEQLHARGAEILAGDMSPQVLEATNTSRQFLVDRVYNQRSAEEEARRAKEEAKKHNTDLSTFVRWCIRTGLYLKDVNIELKSKSGES